jgi:hypothetical protein
MKIRSAPLDFLHVDRHGEVTQENFRKFSLRTLPKSGGNGLSALAGAPVSMPTPRISRQLHLFSYRDSRVDLLTVVINSRDTTLNRGIIRI